ncbi:MAG: DUF1990 family protein [Phototrophicaceae bacterium]
MNDKTKKIALVSLTLSAISAVIWRLWRHTSIDFDMNEVDLEMTTATPHLLDDSIFMGERAPQLLASGYGPLFYRRYYVDLDNVQRSKADLMTLIEEHLNSFSPSDMAIFERLEEENDAPMQVGDDYYIHIAGPWDGPVRVIDVTPTSFSFITLDDHLEAGEIQFRITDHPEKETVTRFEIRSWSRSKDRLVHFLYDVLPVVKFSQEKMWIFFCQRVVEVSEAQALDDIQVMTHRVPYTYVKNEVVGNAERWQQYSPQLSQMRHYGLNFDLDQRESFTEVNGWRFDKYEIDLPKEASGAPQKNGSWELAQHVLTNYEFPDPNLISGIFIPDAALAERVMLLEAKFLIFKFYFGVRISSVIDEQRTDDEKGLAQVWGYSYQTLEGHFEMGEITFEIWKFLDSGEVEFRVHSYSKTGHIANPFYRLGFTLFGRMLQKRFANTALSRMQELVINRLAKNTQTEDISQDVPEVTRA